jgi:hypothetical protein
MAARAWMKAESAQPSPWQDCGSAWVTTHLNLSKVLWPFCHVHPLQPNANGPRRDNDDSMAISPQLYGCLDDERED